MTRNKTFPLFVYGTLKKGYYTHDLIKKSRFLGFAYTKKDYKLLSLGSYPGLIECKNGTNNIEGEVYEIDKEILETTHRYEGVNEGLFSFSFVAIDEFDLIKSPGSNLSKHMINRNLCFGYLFNNQEKQFYPEIEKFTLD